MPREPRVPRELSLLPFRASEAVSRGLLTSRMLQGPSWRRLLPDVYVHTGGYHAEDHRMWCEAVALKLPPGAAIGGLSAAYLWGVDLLPRVGDNPVTVALTGARRLRAHHRIRRVHGTLAADDVARLGGLPLTTELRTAFDLGRRLARVDAAVALDAMLHRRLIRPAALAEYSRGHAGWPGIRQLDALLELVDGRSESPMETRLRLLLHDAGLPRPVAQHAIYLPHPAAGDVTRRAEAGRRGRFVARVDLAYPDLRIAIEYEGDHHRERGQFRRDVARLNALRAAGWLVLRFTADDVLRFPAQTTQTVAASIQERRPTSPAASIT